MAYDPAQILVRDRIRGKIGDINEPPIIPDATYDSVITLYSDWRLACAEMADQLASIYLQRVSSFSRSGGISVSWTNRAENLRAMARGLRQEVADDSNGAPGTLTSVEMVRDTRRHSEYVDLRRYPYDDDC